MAKIASISEQLSRVAGTAELIDEVTVLLAKLECDRVETLAQLDEEHHRCQRLTARVQHLQVQRLLELPRAVQREHDACALDLGELGWHVSHGGRRRQARQQRVTAAERLNHKLRADVTRLRLHCPLVADKLRLESDAMERIRLAQQETDAELRLTVDREARVAEKVAEARQRADSERAAIQAELDAAKRDLAAAEQRYSQACVTHRSYSERCDNMRQQLRDDQSEMTALRVREENERAAERAATVRVGDLESQQRLAEHEFCRLREHISALESQLKSRRAINENQALRLQAEIDQKTERRRLLERRADELRMDAEDAERKSADCDRQRDADEKNLTRMRRELDKVKAMRDDTCAELAQVQASNDVIGQRLMRDEDSCCTTEERLRSNVDAMRKQIKEEAHARTVLQARIQSDSSATQREEEVVAEKQRRLSLKVAEVDSAVDEVEASVVSMRATLERRVEQSNECRRQITITESEMQATSQRAAAQCSELEPHRAQLANSVSEINKRLDHIDWKNEMMAKKMDDIASSTVIMTRSMQNTQRGIARLQSEHAELGMRIASREQTTDMLRAELSDVTSRSDAVLHAHVAMVTARRAVLDQLNDRYSEASAENGRLASHYRRLYDQHLSVKSSQLDLYDGRLAMRARIKDLKQLQQLQQRMRQALREYYRLRGEYNGAELARMEGESAGSARRVARLRRDIDLSLADVASYFSARMSESREGAARGASAVSDRVVGSDPATAHAREGQTGSGARTPEQRASGSGDRWTRRGRTGAKTLLPITEKA